MRRVGRGTAGCLLLLLALAPLGLFPGVADGEVVYPRGVLDGTHEPWVSMAPRGSVVAANPVLSDAVYQFVPWDRFCRRHGGVGPAWNPYSGLGVPFRGNPQAAQFDPVRLIALAIPERHAGTARAWLRLVIAGWLMLGFLRSQGLGWGPAAIGAVGFQLGGFLVPWLAHPHAGAAAWLPGVLWAGDAAWRGVRGAVPALAACYAAQFLAGHPETSLHLTAIAGTFWLVRRGWGGWRRWARLVAGTCLGAALAAPVLLPFVHYLRDSAALAGRGHRVPLPLPGDALGAFALPHALGWPAGGAAWRTALNATECVAYVGVLPWLAAPFAFAAGTRRVALAFAVVAVICGATMLSLPGPTALVESLPGFAWSANRRLLLGVAFAGAALGGIGIANVSRWGRPRAGAVVAIAGVAGAALAGLGATVGGERADWLGFVGWSIAGVAALAACAFRPRLGVAVALAVAAADVVTTWSGYQPTAPAHTIFSTTPSAEALRALRAPGDRALPVGARGHGLVFPPDMLNRFAVGQLHTNDALGDPALMARVERGFGALRVGAPSSALAPFGARWLVLPTTAERFATTARLVAGEEMFAAFAPDARTPTAVVIDSWLVDSRLADGDRVGTVTIRLPTSGGGTRDVDVPMRVGRETADGARPDSLTGPAIRVERPRLVRDHARAPHARFVYRARLPVDGIPIGLRIRCEAPGALLEVDGVGVAFTDGTTTLDSRREARAADELRIYGVPDAWPRAMVVARNRIGEPFPGDGGPAPGRPARIVRYAPEHVVVEGEAAADEALVLSDAFRDGWRAVVESPPGASSVAVPIERAFDAFRAVAVAPGRFRVRFDYTPPGATLGGVLAAVAALLVAIASVRALGIKRERPDGR